MQSLSKFFKLFIEWVISLNFITKEDLEVSLEGLGGLSGAMEDEMYISAYEEIGRRIANSLSYDDLCKLLESISGKLSENPDQLFYFVEAIVDEVSATGTDIQSLIGVCPEQYRSFLLKRFS